MAEKGSATIHMGYYRIDKILERCYEFVEEQKEEMVFVQIIEDLEDFIEALNSFRKVNLEEEEPVQIVIFKLLRKIQTSYKGFSEDYIENAIRKFSGTWLFTPEELSKRSIFDPRKMVYVENAVKQKLFKLYSYREGNGVLSPNTKFRIYPTIGISQSLEEWLQFLEQQNPSISDDSAIVTLFLKLDYVSDHYASFVVSIHQKDSIWIASDQLDFNNPRNRQAARKPDRDKEKHYENVSLPYEIVEELDKLRKSNNDIVNLNSIERIEIDVEKEKEYVQQIVKEEDAEEDRINASLGRTVIRYGERHSKKYLREKSAVVVSKRILDEKNIPFKFIKPALFRGQELAAESFHIEGRTVAVVTYTENMPNPILTIYKRAEILQKPLVNIHPYDRMYFIMLIERLFEELNFDPIRERIMISTQYLNQKLLSGAEFHSNDDGFRGYGEESKSVIAETIESAGAKSTAITKFSYHLALKSPNYEANWLGTAEALDNLIKWTVLEDEADKIKDKVTKEIAPRENIDKDILRNMMEANIQNIYKIGFTYNETFYLDIYNSWSTISKPNQAHFISKNKDGVFKKGWHGHMNLMVDVWSRRIEETRCPICRNSQIYKKTPLLVFRVRHYEELMMLTNVKSRLELPLYYQSYRSHDLVPYMGNSILDNSHPYTLIQDPCSRNHPNGIDIQVFMCRQCYKKLEKSFHDDMAVNKEKVITGLLNGSGLNSETHYEYVEHTVDRYMNSNKMNHYVDANSKSDMQKLLRIIKR